MNGLSCFLDAKKEYPLTMPAQKLDNHRGIPPKENGLAPPFLLALPDRFLPTFVAGTQVVPPREGIVFFKELTTYHRPPNRC
jgi:hypothetical protein